MLRLYSAYATPTERLRYALATIYERPCHIKSKSSVWDDLAMGHHGLYNNSNSAYRRRSMDGIFFPFQ